MIGVCLKFVGNVLLVFRKGGFFLIIGIICFFIYVFVNFGVK